VNAAIVKIDYVAARLNWGTDKVFELVDGETLLDRGFLWVFNLAKEPKVMRRDLRFWAEEIEARKADLMDQGNRAPALALLSVSEVIGRILPESRTSFHPGEIDQLFQIRRRTRIDLHADLVGDRVGGMNFYDRQCLASFLESRWVRAEKLQAFRT